MNTAPSSGKESSFRNLAKAGVLDRVLRIHNLAHGAAVREQPLNMREVVLSYDDSPKIARPVFFRTVRTAPAPADIPRKDWRSFVKYLQSLRGMYRIEVADRMYLLRL